MILLHIVGGLLGLASGAVALSTRKGSRLHRKSGMVFVYAMLVMSASGAVLAALKPERLSVIAGALTFYMVLTALLAVRRPSSSIDRKDVAAMAFGLGVVIVAAVFGVQALSDSGAEAPPAGLIFVFGVIALLAVLGDIRMILMGGLRGTQALIRHLWRMCFALFVAAGSFFLGQSDVIPEPLRIMPLLCTPVLLVLLAMVYWLVRVRFTRWHPQYR